MKGRKDSGFWSRKRKYQKIVEEEKLKKKNCSLSQDRVENEYNCELAKFCHRKSPGNFTPQKLHIKMATVISPNEMRLTKLWPPPQTISNYTFWI